MREKEAEHSCTYVIAWIVNYAEYCVCVPPMCIGLYKAYTHIKVHSILRRRATTGNIVSCLLDPSRKSTATVRSTVALT